MTKRYEEVSLNDDVESLVLDRLRQGNTLAREVAALSVPYGRFYTLLPPSGSREGLLNFELGGKVPGDEGQGRGSVRAIETMDYALVEVIRTYIAGGTGRIVVIENPFSEPGEADVEDVPHLVCYLNEVYHVVAPPATSPSEVLAALRDAKSSLDIRGFMTEIPEAFDSAISSGHLSLVQLRQLAERTVGVFLGVYDGESYLVAQC